MPSNMLWIIILIIFSFNTYAAEIFNLRNTNAKKFIQQLHNTNLSNQGVQWRLVGRPHVDNKYVKHLRYQQYFDNILVFGGYAILHVKVNNDDKPLNAGWVSGLEFKNLRNDLQNMPDQYLQNATKTLEKYKIKLMGSSVLENAVVVPIIYIDSLKRAHWAYRVSGVLKSIKDISKPINIIDAQTGAVLKHWNDLKKSNILTFKARGYGGNVAEGLWNYGFGLYPEIEVKYNPKKSSCIMENKIIKIVDLHHKIFDSNKPLSFKCDINSYKSIGYVFTGYNNDGYDKINGAYSVMDDAYYLASVLRNMYQEWYGTEVLYSYYGKSLPIFMKIHYGTNFNNAFWDGQSMTFGDGDDTLFYPFVSPDIVAHEISHGFTQQNSDLFYFGESGGINEAFSDMATQAMQQYLTGKNTWHVAEEISKLNIPLRFMNYPTFDGISIDSAKNYTDDLDPHESSGVFNKLFYILAEQKGWGVRQTFGVMLKANQDYWYPFSDFVDASCGILLAASDLDLDLNDADDAIHEVGIDDSSCFVQDDYLEDL